MEGFIDSMLDRLLATSLQTALLAAFVWLLCRLLPRLAPATQCWLWWLVALQVLLGLCMAPIPLSWLPPATASGSFVTSIAGPNQFPALAVGVEPSMTAGTVWTWRFGMFLLWVIGLMVMAWSMLRDWQRARDLLQGSADCTDEFRSRIVAATTGAPGVRGRSQLRVSDQIDSPMVIGHFRPRLLLPAHARLSDEELQMAVAHELEHLRRADLWWGIVPALARLCFYFHPLMHLAAREYDIAREAACDAAVVGAGERSCREYGELLVRLGTSQGASTGLAAASPTFRALSRRLKWLQHRSVLPWAGSLAVLVLALALVVPWRLVEPDPVIVPAGGHVDVMPPAAVSESAADVVLKHELSPTQRKTEPAGSSVSVAADVATTRAQPGAPAPSVRVAVSHRPNADDFYPAVSRSLGEEGRSRLRICADELGRVTEVTVAEGSGSPRLDEAAVQMGWHYRLTPAVADGVAVKRQCFVQPVTFTQQPRMSASYEDAPIAVVLQQISGVSGRTIVADESVGGTVTLKVDNAPWNQVLSRVLSANRLVQRTRGDEIVVSAAASD